jgi:hypothetical protein
VTPDPIPENPTLTDVLRRQDQFHLCYETKLDAFAADTAATLQAIADEVKTNAAKIESTRGDSVNMNRAERDRARAIEKALVTTLKKTSKQVGELAINTDTQFLTITGQLRAVADDIALTSDGVAARLKATERTVSDKLESSDRVGSEWRAMALEHIKATNAALGIKSAAVGGPIESSSRTLATMTVKRAATWGAGFAAFLVAAIVGISKSWPNIEAAMHAVTGH